MNPSGNEETAAISRLQSLCGLSPAIVGRTGKKEGGERRCRVRSRFLSGSRQLLKSVTSRRKPLPVPAHLAEADLDGCRGIL